MMNLSHILEPIVSELAQVEEELSIVTERIAQESADRVLPLGILGSIAKHPFAVPGKRMRPALVLLSSRIADQQASRKASISLAVAVEVLHAASLVHDDIIDGAEERRHQVSLNKRFGNRVAVLAGDILYTEFFSLVTHLPLPESERSRILSLFLGTTRRMCVGEILAQEVQAARRSLSFDEYLEITDDKTASLFSASCEAGAIAAGAGEERVRGLAEFGTSFGLAFQMLDDIADSDHGLDPSIALRPKAEEYAARARAAASALGDGRFGSVLNQLVGYLMSHPFS
jgi:geranylgeranyl pyrophosphate synthase